MKESLSPVCKRAETYKFLSVCFLVPDEKLIKMLNSLDDSNPKLCFGLALPVADVVESLKIEYSRLFIGPYGILAPPYGSVYLEEDKQVMGNSTMDVRNRYRDEELEIAVKDAPDNISVELEFMHLLSLRECEAAKASNSDKVNYYLKKQKSFLEDHLSLWVPSFCEKVLKESQHSFYNQIAKLTLEFIESDRKQIDELLFSIMKAK